MYSTRSRKRRKRRPNATSSLAGSVIRWPKTIERSGKDGKKVQVTHGTGNVFEDVGFPAEEAANLKIRADLMLDLRQYIERCGWTQTDAAAFFGETQPRISNLMKGEIGRFSIDKLINMLARAGIRVRVKTDSKAA
jgi:predicted XRE-type DNA-binding protein